MTIKQLFLIIGIAGIINGLVVAIYLFFMKKGNILANRLLGFLLVAAAAKSTFALLKAGIHIPRENRFIIYTLAQTGYYSLAPLFYLYVLALLKKIQNIRLKHIPHFLLSTYILFAVINRWPFNVWAGQAQIIVYLILSLNQYKRFKNSTLSSLYKYQLRWIRNLIIAFSIFWVSLTLIVIINFDKYYFVELSVLFSTIVYLLIFNVIRIYNFSYPEKENVKSKDSAVDYNEDEANQILSKTVLVMQNEKPYENPELSLPLLAKLIDTTPHKLSEVLNKQAGRNFTDFINQYRVEKAKDMLLDGQFSNYKIAAIAFECGFNTLSTFNLAFKKNTGKTPSVYREEMVLV